MIVGVLLIFIDLLSIEGITYPLFKLSFLDGGKFVGKFVLEEVFFQSFILRVIDIVFFGLDVEIATLKYIKIKVRFSAAGRCCTILVCEAMVC